MPLKVLCAGCSADERERAESDVRRVLGMRAQAEPWTVSLVKVQKGWSVTLHGPQARGISCLAPPERLSECIREALQHQPAGPASVSSSAGAAVPSSPEPAAVSVPARSPSDRARFDSPSSAVAPVAQAAGTRQERHQCAKCAQEFVLTYEIGAGEPQQQAPVACPHCWHISRVSVSMSAAETGDYRAAKA
jgi:DNA-directed RNA polymerase subunit RPC12/RpoP